MSKIIFLVSLLFLVAIVTFFFIRYDGKASPKTSLQTMPVANIEIDPTPDRPLSFGYKRMWLAFKTDDPEIVIQVLGLDSVKPANWSSGLGAALHKGTFITPAIDGWVLAISYQLPELGNTHKIGEWQSFMQHITPYFDEIQYFATHRVVEYHAWAMVQNGILIRAYAFLGEAGEVLHDEGAVTEAEYRLLPNYLAQTFNQSSYTRNNSENSLREPTEEDVLKIAALWGLDPIALGNRNLPPSLGWYSPNLPNF